MADATRLRNDYGTRRVVVARGDDEVTREVDIVLAYYALADVGGRAGPNPPAAALWREYGVWAADLGFEGVSTYVVRRLIDLVTEAYQEVLGEPRAGDTPSPG